METGEINCAKDKLTNTYILTTKDYNGITESFNRTFAEPPTVVYSVISANADNDNIHNDFSAWVWKVTKSGFTLDCETANQSKIKKLYVRWWAFGKA